MTTSHSASPITSRQHDSRSFRIGVAFGVIAPLVTIAGIFLLDHLGASEYLGMLLWPGIALAVGRADRRWRWVRAAALAPAPMWTLMTWLLMGLSEVPLTCSYAHWYLGLPLLLPAIGAASAALGVWWGRRAAPAPP